MPLLHELMALRGFKYLETPIIKTAPEGLVASGAYLGMEFEYEGTGAHWGDTVANVGYAAPLRKWFSPHQDGSLRGDDAVELVFKQPLPAPQAVKAMDTLVDIASEQEFKVNRRTGFHIHVNVGNLSPDEFWNLLRLYTLYEPALFTAAGDSRSGSIFCIPWFRDLHLANHVASITRSSAGIQNCRTFGKYSALNLRPVSTFGSVEFRHMRNTLDKGKLRNWTNLVLLLHKAAQRKDFNDWWDKLIYRQLYKQYLFDLYEAENLKPWQALDYPDFATEVNRLTLDNVRELDALVNAPKKEVAEIPQPPFEQVELPMVDRVHAPRLQLRNGVVGRMAGMNVDWMNDGLVPPQQVRR
jgi:Putative amidoligase enzyme